MRTFEFGENCFRLFQLSVASQCITYALVECIRRMEGPREPGRWLCSRAPSIERLWIHSRFGAAGGASAHPGVVGSCWILLVPLVLELVKDAPEKWIYNDLYKDFKESW